MRPTRYNWSRTPSELGRHWYFMSGSGSADPVTSASADALVDKDRPRGQNDHDDPDIRDQQCSGHQLLLFRTSVYGAQQFVNSVCDAARRWAVRQRLTTSGATIADRHIASNNQANSPAFEAQWVQHSWTSTARPPGWRGHLRDGQRAVGVGHTHTRRPPRQDGLGRAGRLTSNTRCRQGRSTRQPRSTVPGDFGWAAYVDAGPAGDNQASHGGSIWEAQYYLQQLALYQKQHGDEAARLLDEHY